MRYMISMLAFALFAGLRAMAADPAPATQPTTAPAVTITWDLAAKHVGETATVTGPVVSTHVSGDKKNLSLNVGKDYPSPARFTIFLPNDPKAGSPDDLYKGKTVTVTGKIILYRKATEIKAKTTDLTIAK